jgi:hypothetical protein
MVPDPWYYLALFALALLPVLTGLRSVNGLKGKC